MMGVNGMNGLDTMMGENGMNGSRYYSLNRKAKGPCLQYSELFPATEKGDFESSKKKIQQGMETRTGCCYQRYWSPNARSWCQNHLSTAGSLVCVT